jgi:predicted metal-dependent enzyme (double-stranded beta helix superfamily)
MRTFEVFQNMLAPGVGTPIHSQNMNEIVLVLKGQGLAKLQDKARNDCCSN